MCKRTLYISALCDFVEPGSPRPDNPRKLGKPGSSKGRALAVNDAQIC